MKIEQPGRVIEHITMLGKKESCVYLLDGGGEYAILGGGLACIIPDIERQLTELQIDIKKIQKLVILHTHFDHCGIVPYFKRKWPWVEIVASVRGKALLSKPKVVNGIGKLNQTHLKETLPDMDPGRLGLEDFAIDVDRAVTEGDTIACGRLRLEVLETPGHSTCSISLYLPEKKAVFVSDAAGIPFGDRVFTAANSDFDDYVESLEKIFECRPEIVLAEHQGARTGQDCRLFMEMSRTSARDMRKRVEDSYRRTGDVESSTREITDQVMQHAPAEFLPAWVVKLVVGGMVYQTSRRVSKV